MISEIDTRALVRHLRSRGVMRGVLSADGADSEGTGREGTQLAFDGRTRSGDARLHPRAATNGTRASCRARLRIMIGDAQDPAFHVVAYDFGIKRNILRRLVQSGCRVTVVPAGTHAEDVLALKPDGVFLSNGPGDPEPLDASGRAGPQADRQGARSSASASVTRFSAWRWAARPTS